MINLEHTKGFAFKGFHRYVKNMIVSGRGIDPTFVDKEFVAFAY